MNNQKAISLICLIWVSNFIYLMTYYHPFCNDKTYVFLRKGIYQFSEVLYGKKANDLLYFLVLLLIQLEGESKARHCSFSWQPCISPDHLGIDPQVCHPFHVCELFFPYVWALLFKACGLPLPMCMASLGPVSALLIGVPTKRITKGKNLLSQTS